MKLTKKLCELAGIINAWDYSNRNIEPFLVYYPQQTGRMWRNATWSITVKGKSYSDIWYEHGAKVFDVYHKEMKQEQFEYAIAWMKQEFGFTEIVKTPIGSWMEKEFVEKRNQEIINAIKQGQSLREK